MNEATVRAFFMTLAAGLSTGFGGCAAFLARRTNQKFLCACLGFSAGVMLYVSMAELFFAARLRLEAAAGVRAGGWLAAAGFFGARLCISAHDGTKPFLNTKTSTIASAAQTRT